MNNSTLAILLVNAFTTVTIVRTVRGSTNPSLNPEIKPTRESEKFLPSASVFLKSRKPDMAENTVRQMNRTRNTIRTHGR